MSGSSRYPSSAPFHEDLMSRFIKTFVSLNQSGIPILTTLDISANTFGNAFWPRWSGPLKKGQGRGRPFGRGCVIPRSFPPCVPHVCHRRVLRDPGRILPTRRAHEDGAPAVRLGRTVLRLVFSRLLTGDPATDGFTGRSERDSGRDRQTPGSGGGACDAGMGQGRNAVYLAGRGWKVTGFDLSGEAIKAASANARKAGFGSTRSRRATPTSHFGTAKWDLIVLTFAWAPVTDPGFVARLRTSLRPDGRIVFEHFIENQESPRPPAMQVLSRANCGGCSRDSDWIATRRSRGSPTGRPRDADGPDGGGETVSHRTRQRRRALRAHSIRRRARGVIPSREEPSRHGFPAPVTGAPLLRSREHGIRLHRRGGRRPPAGSDRHAMI